MNNLSINLTELYAQQDQVTSALSPIPPYQPGRSIVTSCYRSEIPGMFVLLNELARLEINLPIEIFYRNGELNNDERAELSRIYPKFVMFKQIQNNA